MWTYLCKRAPVNFPAAVFHKLALNKRFFWWSFKNSLLRQNAASITRKSKTALVKELTFGRVSRGWIIFIKPMSTARAVSIFELLKNDLGNWPWNSNFDSEPNLKIVTRLSSKVLEDLQDNFRLTWRQYFFLLLWP